MTVQVNTDKNIEGSERLTTYVTDVITAELSRFEDHVTRIEVHLSDENAGKEGQNDKRCLLEARYTGRQPVVASNNADNHEQAIDGAVDKLKHVLATVVGKMQNR